MCIYVCACPPGVCTVQQVLTSPNHKQNSVCMGPKSWFGSNLRTQMAAGGGNCLVILYKANNKYFPNYCCETKLHNQAFPVYNLILWYFSEIGILQICFLSQMHMLIRICVCIHIQCMNIVTNLSYIPRCVLIYWFQPCHTTASAAATSTLVNMITQLL